MAFTRFGELGFVYGAPGIQAHRGLGHREQLIPWREVEYSIWSAALRSNCRDAQIQLRVENRYCSLEYRSYPLVKNALG